MTSRTIVFRETKTVALGQLLCCCIMVGIYALLGRFSLSVILGAATGALLATLNFFVMALCADMALDKGQKENAASGQSLIHISYLGRMVALFLILALCAKSGLFDLIALVLPLVFVRPILTIAEFTKKKGGETQ